MTNKGKKTDLGILKINNEVIASIARNAAIEVSGVEGVKSSPWTIISDLISKNYHNKGINLEINNSEIKIGITIVVKYGVNIPEIANAVQENVRAAIEEMTGLSVSEVNINIGDIHQENGEE